MHHEAQAFPTSGERRDKSVWLVKGVRCFKRREGTMSRSTVGVLGLAALIMVWLTSGTRLAGKEPGAVQAERQAPASASAATPQEQLVRRYCITCHNERLRSGGLSLASVDLGRVGGQSEVLEKVLMKLRGGAMPPAGRPRPDAASLNTVHLTFLDANSHVHDARAAAPTRPEWKLAHLTLHPPGHTAPATRYDPIPGVRQLGQQGLMEGWPVPRGE